MKNSTKIIYLTGKPGVGKYTIAKELARNYSFIVCDNQLINNPIFELLQYDGYTKIPSFAWDSIRQMRSVIFDFLIKERENNYVLTNCLDENKRDSKLFVQVKHMAETRNSLFLPVRLLINKEEHLKRLTRPERRERWKSIDPQDTEDTHPQLSISHPHFLKLEISNLSPEDAAYKIMEHVKKLEL